MIYLFSSLLAVMPQEFTPLHVVAMIIGTCCGVANGIDKASRRGNGPY